MNKLFHIFVKRIYTLNVYKRRIILIFCDFILFWLSTYISYQLLNSKDIFNGSLFTVAFTNSLLGILILFLLGQYDGLTQYTGSKSIYKLAISNFLILLILFISLKFLFFINLNFKFLFLNWILLNVLINIKKLTFRDVLLAYNKNTRSKNKVIIYGAGAAGAQLSNNLLISGGYKIVSFIDDNEYLWGRNINGIKINSPNYLNSKDLEINQILIAMPSLNQNRKIEIFSFLKKFLIPIKQIPSIEDITSGRAKINELRPIKLEEILGRKSKNQEIKISRECIKDNIICVTGAGGSIGQEICNQIMKIKPKKLILFDISEASLFQIYFKLEKVFKEENILIPVIGNATNKKLLKSLINKHNISIIFHAAAYKHVPLVELNPIEGLYNNIFSTKVICECALESKIKNVVLISSDKAVRPSNIMGCSKRISELIVQAFSTKESKTIFSMVRFGNVLFSSGSVVPLFLNQIKNGGPITITHKDITRYFMSISEAVLLVLKTIELSKSGDIFLLDMGSPVKIIDLARQMIKLSGLEEKTIEKPNGNIEIIETGLRPGEKLYEELLIDSKSIPTEHPQIFKGIEKSIPFEELDNQLKTLKELLENSETAKVFQLISKLVPEWKISSINKIN